MSDIIGSLNGLNNNAYTGSSSSANGLEDTLNKDLSNATSEELMSVCKDFEAYFIEQVFKSMEKMVPKDDNEDSSISSIFGNSSSSNSLTSYFKDEMITKYADSAADGEGLGIAQTLYEQMKRNYGISDAE